MKRTLAILPLLLILLVAAAQTPQAPPAPVKNPYAPDRVEPGSVEAIAKFTTEPRFGNAWVAYLPDSDTVPSPTEYLGHVVGAAGELSSTTRIYGYFRKLAETSPRVRIETIGKSEEGRDILLAAVADEAGIRDLDRLKAATAALADPRKTTPEAAEALIASGRPVFYFNAALHSTELGSAEMVMELAYRLAVSDQPMIKRIREQVLVLINPCSEPDGRDKEVDWFYRYLKGKTDFESLPPDSPPYWGHYVFHDNNRDAHQMALQASKAVAKMFFDYHPTVVHDLHESIPLLQTWNGTGPFNKNLDPILLSEWFSMSLAEVGALTAAGMPGVWTWGFSDGWQHVFLDSIGVNHNSIGRGYETYGNGTAETVERVLRPDEERYVGRPVTSQEWYRPMPPPRKFMWSLRNNTNYMESGCLAALDYTAKNAREMLRDFYRKSYNSWQKGVKGRPFAFAIPEDQGDRKRVAEMIGLLIAQGIEVGRATAPFKVAEGEFAAGTYVVRLDQPYRNYAVDLLTPQVFPPDAVYEPYDDVSWSLPLHFGVEAKPVDDAKIVEAALAPVAPGFAVTGKVDGAGPVYLLKRHGPGGAAGSPGPAGGVPRRDRREGLQVRRQGLPGRLVDHRRPEGARGRARESVGRAGPRRHERRGRARCGAPRVEAAAPGRLAFVGRYAGRRLDPSRPRPGEGAVRLHPRRGHPGRAAAREVRRHRFRRQLARPPGPDPRHRQEMGAAGLPEDQGDAEPGRPRRLGGHHRGHRLGGRGPDRGVPQRRRRACHAGQRVEARRSRAGSSATSGAGAARSSRRARSSRSSSSGPIIRWPTVRRT